jgi:hypothetical protein
MRRQWMRPRNSLARYETKLGPPILQVLTEAWGLPPVERAALWRALCASCWSETVALREALIAFRPDRQDGRTFLATVFTPTAAVQCLERLVQEHLLTRGLATRVEEAILHETGTEGTWQPQPPGSVRKGTAIRTPSVQLGPGVDAGAALYDKVVR